MPPDSGNSDITAYYTMKTVTMPPPASPCALGSSQSYLPKVSSTPITSPGLPYSVGQPYPPKLSPAVVGHLQSARAPSPNYFGLAVEKTGDSTDSAALPRENRSPPPASVTKKFDSAIPKHMPLDANPEFEAFRRQIDANRGKGSFNLSTTYFGGLSVSGSATPFARPRLPRSHTHGSDVSEISVPCASGLPGNIKASIVRSPSVTKMDVDSTGFHDSAYVSLDSKRNSEVSLTPPSILDGPRFESPASVGSPFRNPNQRKPSSLRRSSPPHSMLDRPVNHGSSHSNGRPDVAPQPADGPSMMIVDRLADIIKCTPDSKVLILDVRVSPQYAAARVKGALNLCIPTTLLKRATFGLQKLQQTFHADEQQEKFADWRNTTHLIVYDAASVEQRDATGPANMIRKFANEGYTGSMNILCGGFNAFAASFPDLVDRGSTKSRGSLSLGPDGSTSIERSTIAPVIGGVMLPSTVHSVNPFFGNIRQNQDLVDGVGQMDIKVPPGVDLESLPCWLKEAADTSDHGKKVSDKFLEIELKEKDRMTDAYSNFNPSVAPRENRPEEGRVRLCGIEEGGKNRYKDILPFEHARVRLEGRTDGSDDYVNASHLKASRSHKRYIATQGPLPATFEDFWSVIWDQDVRVIVMLTAESEGGLLKCHPYWQDRDFGPLKLRSIYEKTVSLDVDNRCADPAVLPDFKAKPNRTPASISCEYHPEHDPAACDRPHTDTGRRRAKTSAILDPSTPTPAQPNAGSSSSSGSAGKTPFVIIRKFALRHTAHPFSATREITHIHYPSWPDFGAPAEPGHLLALVDLADVTQRATLPADIPRPVPSDSVGLDYKELSGGGSRCHLNGAGVEVEGSGNVHPLQSQDMPDLGGHTRPMLVHCSAGCGRTGAFCTIDSVIDMLKRQRFRHVKRAHRKTAEREKRIAEQAGENTPGKRRALSRGDIPPPKDDGSLARFQDPPAPWPGSHDATLTDSDSDAESIDKKWIDDDSVDLVARTVEDFRGQRLSMVQSLKQFVLCYEAVIEWIGRLQQKEKAAVPGPATSRARSGSMAL